MDRIRVAFAGLAALAVAMGIGRFAFTPLLPMMQDDAGVSLAQGGYLASANYLGYLAGALWAMRPARAQLAIRGSGHNLLVGVGQDIESRDSSGPQQGERRAAQHSRGERDVRPGALAHFDEAHLRCRDRELTAH